MSRRKNHPKKRSPPSSGASATPTESESSTPPSPALQAVVTPVTEVPSLPACSLSESVAPVDLSGSTVAEEPTPGVIRSVLRWVPILGRFV